MVNDPRPEAAARSATDVGGNALPFDIADSAAVTGALAGLGGRWGRLHVLVNNAGIGPNRPEEKRRRNLAHHPTEAGKDPSRRARQRLLDATIEPTDHDRRWMRAVHLDGTFHWHPAGAADH